MKLIPVRSEHTARQAALALGAIAMLATATDHGAQAASSTMRAEIRRTAGGIPHIRADDWAGLGFGTGYVMAQDNLCLLARNFLKVNAQLSRYLGPGRTGDNLISDFFFRMLIEEGQDEEGQEQKGLGKEKIDGRFGELFRGYAAGYNRYLRDAGGNAGISDLSCRGKDWVREITELDVRRANLTPLFLPDLAPIVVAAKPPGNPRDEAESASFSEPTHLGETRKLLTDSIDRGSNGFAFGRAVTATERGMLIANPHFPWHGTGRFYALHHTIRGELDVFGATTVDRAFIGIGVNRKVAWTSTVSPAQRLSFYRLELCKESPTQYLFEDDCLEMKTIPVKIDVLQPDGSLATRSHTFYATHFDALLVGGDLSWSWKPEANDEAEEEQNRKQRVAFAVRSTKGEQQRILDGGALGFYAADNVREVKEVVDRFQAVPTNLLAADDAGKVLFAEAGPVIHVTDAQLYDCAIADIDDMPMPLVVLDGSRDRCQWGWHGDLKDHEDEPRPDILPPELLPFLFRDDHVSNQNDSYWLTNPEAPLTGFPQVVGHSTNRRGRKGEAGELTLRTRSAIQGIRELLASEVTLEALQGYIFENRNHAGELLRDNLVKLCEAHPVVKLPENHKPVRLQDLRDPRKDACEVLKAWDLHSDLDSRGAHLFREFLREANAGVTTTRWLPESLSYRVPFDPIDPIKTPRGLDTDDNPAAVDALARAVLRLRNAGVPLSAALGDVQSVIRNGEKIPVHGGAEMEGVLNKVEAAYSTTGAYPEVTGASSSWVLVAGFEDAERPVLRGILTYSLSSDPTSPHFADQTRLYSRKQWLDIPFEHRNVVRQTVGKLLVLEE